MCKASIKGLLNLEDEWLQSQIQTNPVVTKGAKPLYNAEKGPHHVILTQEQMTTWVEYFFFLIFSSVQLGPVPLPTFGVARFPLSGAAKPPTHGTALLLSWIARLQHAFGLPQSFADFLQASSPALLSVAFPLPERKILVKKETSTNKDRTQGHIHCSCYELQ